MIKISLIFNQEGDKMNSKDSYPHVDTGNNSALDLNKMGEVVPEESNMAETTNNNSENDDYRGSENEVLESKNKEDESSESQIIVDDESEDYEHENTGIKIKYTLKQDEVEDFIEHSEGFAKNRKEQKKHTVIQLIVLIIMLVLGLLSINKYYLLLAIFPVISLLFIWIAPYLGVKKLARDILKHSDYLVEIFPDKIDVTSGDMEREIPLDGSCQSSEFENMIFIFSEKGLDLIIPLRVVEEDLKADVQAMVLAGTNPRHKK